MSGGLILDREGKYVTEMGKVGERGKRLDRKGSICDREGKY